MLGALATVVTASSLASLVAPHAASASQVTDLEAKAAAISQRLVQDQLQVDAYQQQYSVASAKVAADDQAVAAIGDQLDADQQQITSDTRTVRELAIKSYMNGGKISGSDTVLFATNAEQAQLTNEYAAIAAGSMETALDQLQAAQRTLETNRATLQQVQSQDQSEQARQASFLAQANGAHQQLAVQQGQVTGQLAAAVAAQAGLQASSAAAAVTAAERVATPGTAGSSSANTVDPALNAYLQCVVRAESGGNYGAVSPNGVYMGAFQFSQATWNGAARAAGRPDLVGVAPNRASRADQDTVAVALYALDGRQPWLGDRC